MHALKLFAAVVLVASACSGSPAPTAGGSIPVVAHVVCEDDVVTVEPDRVRARADGVHVEVRNATRSPDVAFSFSGPGRRGDEIAVTTSGVAVAQMAPGRNRVWCTSGTHDGGPVGILEVVDPDGLYVPPDPRCPGDRLLWTHVDFEFASPEKGDLVKIARRGFTGLRSGDVVERAGYPESDPALVRVVRRGRVVAVADYERVGGGWLGGSSLGCGQVQ